MEEDVADFEFKCPGCGNTLEIDEVHRGKKTTCPACGKAIVIPDRSLEAPIPRVRGGAPVQVSGLSSDLLPEEERDVFRLHPAWRAHFGKLLLAVLLPLAGLALVLVTATGPTLKRVLGLTGLALGLIFYLTAAVRRYSLMYRLSTQRLFVYRGLVSRRVEELELFRVRDIDVRQNFWQRVMGYGRMTVYSTDSTTPKFEIAGLPRPLEVKDAIRTQFRTARIRERVRPTEFISDFDADQALEHDPSL
jgi:membrane protein YdbS with pleckstrin-like domain/DNA-directed RNA polymerase subunit RPC12/RpoP